MAPSFFRRRQSRLCPGARLAVSLEGVIESRVLPMSMRKALLRFFLPPVIAVLILAVVIVAGWAARDRLRQANHSTIAFAGIDCPPPPRRDPAALPRERPYVPPPPGPGRPPRGGPGRPPARGPGGRGGRGGGGGGGGGRSPGTGGWRRWRA